MPMHMGHRASRSGTGRYEDPPAVEVDFALVRGIKRAQQVQERASPRSALPDDRDKFTTADFDIQTSEHGDLGRALAVTFKKPHGPKMLRRH